MCKHLYIYMYTYKHIYTFSRIRNTSISVPKGAKTASTSASSDANGTMPTKSLYPALS